jgi:uncharacterized nucleotidyltransferase DUF6036
MDDSDDRAYSRAPELEDLIGLCRALNAEGARYVLIGGFAVILHGFVRATKDIDLLIDASEENVRSLKRAMSTLPDNAAAELRDDDVSRYTVVRVADEFVVDVMARACGLGYEDAVSAGIDQFDVDGVEIPTASKQFLVKTKDTVRDHDKLDVRYLLARIAEER